MLSKTLKSSLGVFALICSDVVTAAHYAISGVKTGINPQTGARPARRNILDLQNDLPAWSLYVQALTAMQQTPEDDILSWFQVSGIHGKPYYSWDGYAQTPGAPLTGYCTHSSALFPTWHRPYLALIEQILAKHAQTAAKAYNSPVYQAAADNFRLPYWDYAAIPTMPNIVNSATVQINTPTGMKEVPNPSVTYKFQKFPLDPSAFPNDGTGITQRPKTVRAPVNGESAPNTVNLNLANARPSLMEGTYNVFAKSKLFNAMASTASSGASFEAVHNTVHSEIGGRTGGHMGWVSYSAFDPIFWLVHNNADRLIALWQAMNPDTFLVPQIDNTGTFTIRTNTQDTETTPLTPFTSGDGETPYTSVTSRYIKDFGYTYPEIQDWLPRTKSQLAANITAQVNALYNPGGRFTPTQSSRRLVIVRDSLIRQWSIDVKVSSKALNERFVVQVYLGDKTIDLSNNTNIVGNMYVSQLPGAAEGSIHNEFSLQKCLVDAGVDVANVDKVVKYLTKNLNWAVTKFVDGEVVPNDKVAGLYLHVHDEIVIPPNTLAELPVYGIKTGHNTCTSGKAGGAAQ